MRIKNRWNKKAKPQSIEEIAGALGFISWTITTNSVLELEHKGYQTNSNAHRLQIIQAFLIFLVQVADRLAYDRMENEERQRFITALALHVANTFADNQRDMLGEGEHRQTFIDALNQQGEDYAELSFRDGEAGFDFLRYFGEQVAAVMAEKHFVSQQVMDIEGPEAIKTFKQSMQNLLP
ncbi:MAG: hypothetical protein VSS75_001160 [Candidatus Parabeggiatoa sp.]|nr:hypothetical protein [Candidatus Parabeggiatoa sp.]